MIEFTHIIQTAVTAVDTAHEASAADSGGVVGLLGLNWKLFIAQLINFGLIIFVLWKWVFTPVTTALENRTKKIEQSLQDAEAIKKEMAGLEAHKLAEQKRAQAEFQKVVAEAENLGAKQKEAILAEARKNAEKLVTDAEKRIAEDKDKTLAEVKKQMAGLITLAAEKIIAEKLSSEKDAKLIKESMKNIG